MFLFIDSSYIKSQLDIVTCDTVQVTNQWQAIGHCGMWHNSSDQSVASHWTLWQCDSLSDQSVTNHWTLWQCDSLSDQSVTNLWNLEVDLKKKKYYGYPEAFNTTFNNISVISFWSVLLVDETGVPCENHKPAAIYWQT